MNILPLSAREKALADIYLSRKYAWIKMELLLGRYSYHSEEAGTFKYRLHKDNSFFTTNIKLHK